MLDNQLSRSEMARETLVNGGCNPDGPTILGRLKTRLNAGITY